MTRHVHTCGHVGRGWMYALSKPSAWSVLEGGLRVQGRCLEFQCLTSPYSNMASAQRCHRLSRSTCLQQQACQLVRGSATWTTCSGAWGPTHLACSSSCTYRKCSSALLATTSAWQSLTTRPWSLMYSPLIHLVPEDRTMTCACLASKPEGQRKCQSCCPPLLECPPAHSPYSDSKVTFKGTGKAQGPHSSLHWGPLTQVLGDLPAPLCGDCASRGRGTSSAELYFSEPR